LEPQAREFASGLLQIAPAKTIQLPLSDIFQNQPSLDTIERPPASSSQCVPQVVSAISTSTSLKSWV
jgi:hypothetical protein